jgi:hypothetical protein
VPAPRRRLLGPFFILALLVSIAIIYFQYDANHPRSGPVIIPSEKGSPVPREFPYLIPLNPVNFILGRASTLNLTSDQRKELGKLESSWTREAGPKVYFLQKESEKIKDSLTEGKSLNGAGMEKSSGDYRELSRQVAQLRRTYWKRCLSLLTSEQTVLLEKELKKQ